MSTTYAEFIRHRLVHQQVSSYYDIGLRRNRLGKLEEQASRLGQALRREEDGILKVLGERAEGVPLIELFGSCQRVCHVRHLCCYGVVGLKFVMLHRGDSDNPVPAKNLAYLMHICAPERNGAKRTPK